MICAEDEIGISDDHSGIMVLRDDAIPGEPLSTYLARSGLPTQDVVLDISITPNRPDAICHIGVARDVSALCHVPLQYPTVQVPTVGGDTAQRVSVTIECSDKCQRYVAMLVSGVTVADSPTWLKQRLEAIGLRPINNIVDVTNFVMHECGQPLHAFDYHDIAGSAIVVRESRAGEHIKTLDGKERHLPLGTVLICDARRPVAIGGIMGAANSEVTDSTTEVLIESAYFDPSTTRRSARALGIDTDASYRFERGVNAEGQAWAAARAAMLIAKITGGSIADGMAEAQASPPIMPTLKLRHHRISRILGVEIPPPEIERILSALGFTLSTMADDAWQVRVPSYRPDVSREIDLIEEVIRIHGLDNIPAPSRTQVSSTAPPARPEERLRIEAYGVMRGRGYREIYTNSLLSKSEAQRFCSPILGVKGSVAETVNAVSQSMTTLRPSLLPGILQVMRHNQHHGREELRFFEFGHVFHRTQETAPYIPGFSEHDGLVMALSGVVGPTEWGSRRRAADFFDLKGDVESLLNVLRLPNIRTKTYNEPSALTSYHSVLYIGKNEICRMGRLIDVVSEAYDIKAPVFFAEFNWTRLVSYARSATARQYAPFSRYPVVRRDLSLEISRSISAHQLMRTIRKANRDLLKEVTVFDLYADKDLDPFTHRIAFSLYFGARRNLQDREVDRAVQFILTALKRHHGARLYGSDVQTNGKRGRS